MKKESFTVTGRVEFLGITADDTSHVTKPVAMLDVRVGWGIDGVRHAGVRKADVREKPLLGFGIAKGTPIANMREFSAVSTEELTEIAEGMGLAALPSGALGENIVISGIPRLTQLPTGTLLFFRGMGANRTAVLSVWGENKPCIHPGNAIQERHPDVPGLAAKFPKAAVRKRGVVGWIYCNGLIHLGDAVVVHVPTQQIYEP